MMRFIQFLLTRAAYVFALAIVLGLLLVPGAESIDELYRLGVGAVLIVAIVTLLAIMDRR